MCLDTKSKKKPETEGVGYKLFRRNDGGSLRAFIHDSEYQMGRWYTADGIAIEGDEFSYPSGFHIYKSRNPKKLQYEWSLGWGYVLAKVQYRKAHTQGTQDRLAVLVAKQMKILKVVHIFLTLGFVVR